MFSAANAWHNISIGYLYKEKTVANTLQQLSQDLAGLVEGAANSVVQLDARRRLPATGIAWSENLVVTASHVVETDDDISVGAPAGEGLAAELVGRDPRRDLALLRVDGGLTAANLAEPGGLRVGELALALGRPRPGVRASIGIVAGLASSGDLRRRRQVMRAVWENRGPKGGPGRRRKRWQRRFQNDIGGEVLAIAGDLIHVDLTMYPGFSGGPLVGADGRVHGMTTSGFGGGFSLAIPIAALSNSVAALQEHGEIRSGYLGTGLQAAQLPGAVAAKLQQSTGLLIVSVEDDSPAAAAGFLVGDILTALDSKTVEDIDELQALLLRLEIGATVTTEFVRGGDLRSGKVTIGVK